MARTLVGTLILRLQENISAGAGKAAGALGKLGAAVDGLGKSGSGFSRLRTSAALLERDLSRLGSAPWGARMQSQLERLGAGARDIDRVRNEWNKLIADMNSRGLKKGAMSQEIATWRTGVIGHFSAVRLEAEKTKKSLANIWKPMATAAGLGVGAYVFGRLGRSGMTASSEFERAKSRSYFAGLNGGEQGQLRDKAVETSQKYRTGYGSTLDTLTDAALNFGSVDKAMKVADTLAAAQVYLSNLFGAQGASDQLRRMTKALDTLEINDPDRIHKVVDGLIKAQSVESKEFSPEQWAEAIKYGRAASRFFSDDFLTTRLPALVSESSGSDVGTMLQSLYQGFGTGRAPKHALAAQQKYGLREGFSPFVAGNKKKGIAAKSAQKGKLINVDEFRKDPISWIYNRAMPALKAAGVDTENDDQLAEALGDIIGQRTQGDILTRAIRSQEQYERKRKDQYPKAKGLDAAREVADRDPFAGYEAFKNSLGNLSTSLLEFANPTVMGALSGLSSGFNSLAAALATMDISKINSFGAAITATGALGLTAAGGVLAVKGIASLALAGPSLITAAASLEAAAVSLGAAGGATKLADAATKTGWVSWLLSRLPLAAGAGGGVLLGGAMLEAGKPTSPAAFPYRNDTWDPDAPSILRRAKLEQDQKKQGQDMEASRGAAFKKLDTSSLDEAGAKAAEVGEKMKADLNITAAPKVDASSISAARAEVDALQRGLERIGSMASGLRSQIESLRGTYSDYGIAP